MKNFFFSAVLLIFVGILWVYKPLDDLNNPRNLSAFDNSANKTENVVKRYPDISANRETVIFVTAGSSGVSQEAVLELAKNGYYVLVGVATPLERKSFTYLQRKGLELVHFDLLDPTTYPDVVYRLRHIRRDLDRPLGGMIINFAGKDSFILFCMITLIIICNHASYCSVDYVEKNAKTMLGRLEIDDVETNYKAIVKSPIKFAQVSYAIAVTYIHSFIHSLHYCCVCIGFNGTLSYPTS